MISKNISNQALQGSVQEISKESFASESLLYKLGLMRHVGRAEVYRFYVPTLNLGSQYVEASQAGDVKTSLNTVTINKFQKFSKTVSANDLVLNEGQISQALMTSIATGAVMAAQEYEIVYLKELSDSLVAQKGVGSLFKTVTAVNAQKNDDTAFKALSGLIMSLLTKNKPGVVAEGCKAENLIALVSPNVYQGLVAYYTSTGKRTVELERDSSGALSIYGVKVFLSKKVGKNIVANQLSTNLVVNLSKFEAIVWDKSVVDFCINELEAGVRERPNSLDKNYILQSRFGVSVNPDLKEFSAAIINSNL